MGVVYAVANHAAAVPCLGPARLVRRLGAVRAVVATRVASIAALLAMAILSSLDLVALALVLRSALNSLGMPARQSYVMGVAEEHRRGMLAAVGALPSEVTSSVSPAVAGALRCRARHADLRRSAVHGANAVTYWVAFQRAAPPEERHEEHRDDGGP